MLWKVLIFLLYLVAVKAMIKNECPIKPSKGGVPYLSFYLGVNERSENLWIDETRASNLLHISPGFDNVKIFGPLLDEVEYSGCFAMVSLSVDISTNISYFNSTRWHWMLPIIMKHENTIKAIYLTDEPFLNHKELCSDRKVCVDIINEFCDFIHKTTDFKFPIITTMSSGTIRRWDSHENLPTGLDWIGMDCYSNDFHYCGGSFLSHWSIRDYYKWIDEHTASNQYFTIVPPTWYDDSENNGFQVDPSKIFSVYEDYYDMVKEIGIQRFKLFLPFVWAVPQVDFLGAKNFPLLSVWWNMVFQGENFKLSNETYLDGLIFGCVDSKDCEKVLDPEISTSVNIICGNEIHPITYSSWIDCGCKNTKFLKVKSSDDFTLKSLVWMKMGSDVTTKTPEILDFLKKSCLLSFTSFPSFQ